MKPDAKRTALSVFLPVHINFTCEKATQVSKRDSNRKIVT